MPSNDGSTVSGRPSALLDLERQGDDLDRELLRAVEVAQRAVGDLPRPGDVPVGVDCSLLPAVRRLAGEWRALDRQAGDAGRRLDAADAVADVVGASVAGFGRGLGRFAGGVVEGLVAMGERDQDNRDVPWRLLRALRDGGLPGLLDRAEHEVAHAARRDAGLLTGSARQFVDTRWSGASRTGPPLAPRVPAAGMHGERLDLEPAAAWGRAESLTDHYRRHGGPVSAVSEADYVRRASELLQRSLREGLPPKVDVEGVIRVYDPTTNTFGAFNPDGTARTFFMPRRREAYWSEQPGSPPWQPWP